MSDQGRQKKLLAVLLVILLAAATYRWFEFGSEGQAVSRSAGRGAGARQLSETEIPHLNLEDLRLEPATYSPGRDPFRFGAAPAPKPPPAPPRETPRVRRRPPKPQPAPTQPQARPAAPRPPAVDFVYLGSFGPQQRRIAVFERDKEIYNALAGDVLLERFIVDKIGFESADIKFVGFPDAPETRLQAGG